MKSGLGKLAIVLTVAGLAAWLTLRPGSQQDDQAQLSLEEARESSLVASKRGSALNRTPASADSAVFDHVPKRSPRRDGTRAQRAGKKSDLHAENAVKDSEDKEPPEVSPDRRVRSGYSGVRAGSFSNSSLISAQYPAWNDRGSAFPRSHDEAVDGGRALEGSIGHNRFGIGSGHYLADDEGNKLRRNNDGEVPKKPGDTASRPQEMLCSFSTAPGVYGTPISVKVSCSEKATIYYCVQVGGGHCDPSTGNIYSEGIELNLGDHLYDVSFFAQSNSGYVTEIASASYKIDTKMPDLMVDFPLVQAQTTQLPLVNVTQSVDFGKEFNYYSQVNLKGYNPVGSSCREIFDSHMLYSPTPVLIQSSMDLGPLDPLKDQIEQSIDLARLVPGDNYIVTFVEDRQRQLVTCQTQKVIVKDFPAGGFTLAGAGTLAYEGATAARPVGGFVSFGHFQVDPLEPKKSGKGKSAGEFSQLVSGLWSVFFQ